MCVIINFKFNGFSRPPEQAKDDTNFMNSLRHIH